jgi:hypothetical protein
MEQQYPNDIGRRVTVHSRRDKGRWTLGLSVFDLLARCGRSQLHVSPQLLQGRNYRPMQVGRRYSKGFPNPSHHGKTALPSPLHSVCYSTQNQSGSEHPLDLPKVARLANLFVSAAYKSRNIEIYSQSSDLRGNCRILVCTATAHVNVDTKYPGHIWSAMI